MIPILDAYINYPSLLTYRQFALDAQSIEDHFKITLTVFEKRALERDADYWTAIAEYFEQPNAAPFLFTRFDIADMLYELENDDETFTTVTIAEYDILSVLQFELNCKLDDLED